MNYTSEIHKKTTKQNVVSIGFLKNDWQLQNPSYLATGRNTNTSKDGLQTIF